MQLAIFVIWLIFLVIAMYYSFGKKRHEAHIALIALGFGLFGILTGSTGGAGIEFLSQVDTNGVLVYTAHTAANDISIKVMGYAGFAVGIIGIIKFFAAMLGRDS